MFFVRFFFGAKQWRYYKASFSCKFIGLLPVSTVCVPEGGERIDVKGMLV